MNDLRYLEFKRLIKELEFVESDYEYQSEIIGRNEPIFKKDVVGLVERFPKLNDIMIESKLDFSKPLDIEPSQTTYEPSNDNVKKIYREIVKSTHPDRISNLKLNELYIEATKAYECGDSITLYRVCNDLMIDFNWGEEEIERIKERISDIKGKIKLLKSTYTYKWIIAEKKEDVVIEYIKNSLVL